MLINVLINVGNTEKSAKENLSLSEILQSQYDFRNTTHVVY